MAIPVTASTNAVTKVTQLYVAMFGRAPDTEGLNFWGGALDAGQSVAQVAQAMFGTTPARAYFPEGSTSQEVVQSFYVNVLGRQPDADGLAFWVARLDALKATGNTNAVGQVVTEIINIVTSYTGNDPAGVESAQLFANKLEVANFWVSENGNVLDSAKPIVLVNSDPASVNQVKAQILNGFGDIVADTTFTLKEVYTETTVVVGPEVERVVMWGYNPHAHGETGVDNLDGDNPDGNDNNLTNEGPADGGVPVSYLYDYLETVAGLDFVQLGLIDVVDGVYATVDGLTITQNGDGTQTISVTLPNGTVNTAEVALGELYFKLVYNALFDSEGNSRLYEVVRAADPNDVGSTVTVRNYIPIRLTPSNNNGGTIEQGYTTAGDDLIVAGRLDLLHGAYIDGGAGRNTLEVDAKGTYAQPVAVLNVQEIHVQNLPNVYTGGTGGYLGDSNYPGLGNGSGSSDSVLDLSRAVDIDRLVVTEGTGTGAALGDLTIVGVRNGATLRLEGGFTQDVTVHYGEGLTGPLTVELLLGQVTGNLNFAHNTDALNLVSLGGVANSFGSEDIGGRLTSLTISGDAALFINGDLDNSFQDETPVTIDASANTKGVDLTLTGSEKVTFIGSQGNDRFQVATSDDSSDIVGVGPNDDVVTISGSNGNNHFEVSATTLHVTAGNGNNNVEVAGRFGDVTLGNGNNSVYADSDEGFETLAVTVGDGNNIIRAEGSETVTITAGDGANRIDADTSANVNITAGDGGNTVTAVNTQSASVTTGAGNDKITASAATITIDAGAGNDVVTVAGIAGELSESAAAGLNLMLVLDDSGSMSGSRITALKSGLNGMLDGLEANGVNAATITIVFASTATASAWGTIDQARAVIDAMGNGGGTNYEAALAAAMAGWDTSGKLVGANNVSVFVSDADSSLDPAVASDWQDFLVANSIVSYAVGLDVASDAGLAEVAYNGQTNSDMAAILTDSNGLAHILDGIGEGLVGTSGKQALVTINLGEGQNTLHLGDADQLAQGLVALEGSSITGENITMVVNANSDLRAATLSGISKVVLDNADVGSADRTVDNGMLTITASQFVDIGAANFSVEGSIFHTHGTIKIIVEEDISLASINVNSLPRNIDLLIEINDGATLTMTAEQLHKWVAQNGVTLADDGNTDDAGGKVIITGGGENFDPFNTSDTVKTSIGGNIYYGGSLSDDFSDYNVTVNGGYGGYDRPSDTPNQVVWTIDGDQYPVVGAVSTWNYNIEIIGDNDITFTGALNAGLVQGVNTTAFTVDFSQLQGDANGLTLGNFENVGAVYGNGIPGDLATVYVELDNASDYVVGGPGEGQGLVSSGVNEYVVTKIGATATAATAHIYLCDTTQDLEVIALRGNYQDTLNVHNAAWGLAFELQGGTTLKADGPTGTANVGKLVANYEWDGADAVVNLVHSVAGDTRTIKAYGIEINNADSITVNVAGSASIDAIAGDSLNELMFNGSGNVAVTAVLPTLDVIDASGVTGTFAATIDQVDGSASTDFVFTGAQGGSTLSLIDSFTATSATTIDGGAGGMTLVVVGDETVDLDAASLSGIEAVVLGQGSTIVLTVAQAVAIGEANFSTPGAATASVELSGLNGEPFVVPDFADDITITLVSIKADPVVTLHADTNLTGIGALAVPGGTTLNLTAAQYQQLTDEGTITILAGTTGPVTVNITDLSTADLAGGFDVSGVADAITLNLQVVGSIDLSAADLTGVDAITFGDDATLTLGDIQQGNGVAIVGGANSTLVFKDTGTTLFEDTDASGFNVTYLKHTNTLTAGGNRNIDDIFTGLAQTITKVVYNGEGWVNAVDQTVIIEAGTTVLDSLVYNKVEADVELQDFTINLMGGVELSGHLRLSTGDKFADANDDGNQDAGENYLIRNYLQTLTINSTGTAANLLTGVAANIIDGDVTPMGINGSLNNNLLAVAINATQALTIIGKLVFNSNVGNDNGGDGMTVNDVEDAVATLTVTGTADVNVGTIDTSDADVDGLNVVNEGSGTITATINSANVQNADVLSFTATGTGDVQLNVVGNVDLSGDVLTAVSQITIADGATLTLSQAQFDALGAANIIDGGNDGSAILNLNGVNAAFDATTIDANIDVQTLTLAGSMDFAATASNLTGVDQIVVPEGATLTLTAAQFQQLKNAGTIVGAGAPATTSYTVNITGLTQADIDGGAFDTSGITAGTITLALGENVNLSADDVIENVDSVIMADGQTLGLKTHAQADDLVVQGGANTTVNFLFDIDFGVDGEIEAAGYNVTTLRALAVSVDNQDVEVLIDNLPSSVTLNLYEDPSQVGYVSDIHRVVVIEPGVQTPAGFVAFNASDANREVRTLKITFQGDGTDPVTDANGNIFGAVINGNLVLDAYTLPVAPPAVAPIADKFSKLTLVSEGTGTSNAITGNITPLDTDGAGNKVDNNLLNIEIQAASAFTIGGDIVFNSTAAAQNTATLTVNGVAPVSIEQLVVNGPHIDVLAIDNDGGALTITGASPSINAGAAESIVLTGDGAITLGTVESTEDFADGITGTALSEVDASGLSGDLYIENISGVDANLFSFTSGTGVTNVTVKGQTLDDDGNAATTSGWNFDLSNAAAGSELHLDGNTYTDGVLNIVLGANTTLYIDATTDLTGMNLSISQVQNIVLADGVTLTLTAAQAHDLNIVGANGAASTGVVNITQLGTGAYDLSGISADIAGTVTLAANDVTLNAATDLGDFSVTLNTLADEPDTLVGQTIRFQNVAQAEREVIAANDATPGTGNSTNVVWLFNSITAPVDTSGYENLGRLWISQTLATNSNNIEQLFTTLQDSIVRVEFTSLAEVNFALASADVNRTVELVAFTNLAATGLVFSDADRYEHVASLTLDLGGSVNAGNLSIDNVVAPSANPLELTPIGIAFNTLTINSARALHEDHYLAPDLYVNDNDGTSEPGENVQPVNLNVVGNIGVGTVNGLDLLTVVLNTGNVSAIGNGTNTDAANLALSQGANLRVGTITFDTEDAASTAVLTVTGANTTTIASLNTSDADITGLTITNSGPGTLTVEGASPAAAVSNTETLIINATGDVVLGTAGDATKPGVSGADLSLIDVNGSGNVDLGVIALVDGNDFTLDTEGSSGAVTAVFDGMTLNAGGNWTVEGAWTGGGTLSITLKDTVTLGAGTLTIDDAVITISGNVNLTTLAELNIDVSDVTFIVPAGNSLTILAEDADGLTVTGDGLVTITELEATPGANFANVMTTDGDTGTVEVLVTTDVLTPVNFTGDMGKAHVTVSGNGVFDVTGASSLNSVVFDHDGNAGTPEVSVMSSYTVGAAATLVLTAAQGDDRTVNGAGTTNVEDIGAYAGSADMSLAGVASATVNIAVDTSVTLDRADNLGAAGPGRVITIGNTDSLTAPGSVVTGQYIQGLNATLEVDDENDGATPDTPITADLSNVSAQFITLVVGAEVGTITFPVLYGDPTAVPAEVIQTVTLTAVQADGQTIVGDNGGTEGEVVVKDLGAEPTDLGLINAAIMTAHVSDAVVVLDPTTDLGSFDVVIDAVAGSLTLSAAQADGIQITDGNITDDAVVTVTALEATPNADLSQIDVSDETALLDANGGVTLGANLGADMEVIVSDSVAGGSNVVTFTGAMNSASTTFTIAADDIGLVFDANNAHDLTVAEQAPGYVNSAVTVNNVDGDEMDLSGITADTLVANVPADAVMHANTDFGGFVVRLAEGADITMTQAQFLAVGATGALDVVDFDSIAAGAEEIVTVTGWTPATALDTSVVSPNLALVLHVDPASAPAVTVNALTDLSGVEEIVIPAGVTLTMTADQFQQIQTSATVTGAGTLNITNLDSDNADIDLSTVTAQAGTISLEDDLAEAAGVATTFSLDTALTAGGVSVEIDGVVYSAAWAGSHGQTLANFKTALNASGDFAAMVEGNTVTIRPKVPTDSYAITIPFATVGDAAIGSTSESIYIVMDAAAVLDNATGGKFSVLYTANGQSLTLSSEPQADGRNISENGYAGNVLVLGFTTADDVADNNAVIQAGDFDVDHVWVLNDYLFNEFGINTVPANFEFFLEDLAGTTLVTVYDVNTLLQANVLNPGGLTLIDRTVTVDQETTIQASIAFNDLGTDAEVRNLTLNLEGNSVIVGNLQLPQDKDPNADLNNPDPNDDSLPLFFDTLTINSTNESGLPTAPNRITGAIFADNGSDGPGSESLAETFVLTLNPAMSIVGNEGQIGFDGTVMALLNGWDDADVAAALAGLTYNNWSATDISTAESSTFTVGALVAGQTVTINGLTVTATAAATADEVAAAFGGVVAPSLLVSGANGTPTGWTGAPTIATAGATVTFTNTVNGDATNFTTSTGTNPAAGVATNGASQVEFLNLNAGVVTDVVNGDFTFVANNGSTVGLTGTVATTQQGSFVANENNLYTVVINATHDLVIDGELEMRYMTRSNSTNDETVTATITVNGTGNVTIGSVNTDDVHITGVTLINNGTGTVSAPGTSPGAAVSNTEVLTINVVNAAGVVNLGTAGDASKPGVSGADLSLIDVNGAGDANLGVIALVDGMNFYLDATGNSGDVTATIGATLADGGVWSFANGADGTLNLTINEDAVFTPGGTLSIQGATITIDGDIDLSGVDLSGVQSDCEFFVPAGSVLTLTVDQVLAFQADSIVITGEGTVKVVGDADDANASDLGAMLMTVNVDLSGVTLTVADADSELAFQNAGATDDGGVNPVAQNLIGSINNDRFLMDAGNNTVTGGAGDDVYEPTGGDNTFNVDAGTDTIGGPAGLDTGDVLVVSTGATAEAAGIIGFVATADTVNNGTANLSTDVGGGEINVALAGGTSGFNLLGGVGADTLTGGANADVINGGGSTQVANPDTLTGNGGADAFFFNVGSSTPIQPGSVTTIAGVDREVISLTADGNDDGDEVFSITYILNGLVRVVTIDTTAGAYAGLDVSIADDVLTAIKSAFDGLPGGSGVTVTLDLALDTATFTALNGAQLTVGALTQGAGTFTGLVGGTADGTDVPQESLVTLQAGALGTDLATVGETYRLGVTFTNGATNAIEYVVQAGDDFADVAQQLDTLLTAQVGGAVTITANPDGTIDIVDADADNGGFTVSTSVISAVTGTGASNLGATDILTADTITDFETTVDNIAFEGMADGTGTNYDEAAGVVDYVTALSDANLAMDGTVRYYLTSVNETAPGAGDGYGVLFFDANGDGGVDGVVQLLGVTEANFEWGDISA